MPFIAKLLLDDEEVNVLHCSYRFTQATNTTGRPCALPRGGSVYLVVESTGSTDLFDWMISNTQTKSGRVVFYRSDNMIKSKSLAFTDAHCVDYCETFDHQGSNPMQIQLTISAHKISLNDSEYVNNWPE